jgi:hypothetical protein
VTRRTDRDDASLPYQNAKHPTPAAQRISVTILVVFGGLAVVLSAIGL